MLSSCKTEPFIAVIIVNYNGLFDTIECLNSIQNVDYDNYVIILIDNASTIDPESYVTHLPKLIYVRSDQNIGFTGGNNLGLKKAYEINADYVFLLNNDTVVSENVLSCLLTFMETHPEMGLIGPVNYYFEAGDIVSFAGGHLNRNSGLVEFFCKGQRLKSIENEYIPCNFVEGSALFLSAKLIREIGGFYEDYFLTSEESELCVKVADLGYQLAVVPTCAIWHKISQSMGAESYMANYFIFRNKLWFIKRNGKLTTLRDRVTLIRYIVVCLMSFGLKKRNFAAFRGIIEGVYDYFRGVKGIGKFAQSLNASKRAE